MDRTVKQKIDTLSGGHGTILFFEDQQGIINCAPPERHSETTSRGECSRPIPNLQREPAYVVSPIFCYRPVRCLVGFYRSQWTARDHAAALLSGYGGGAEEVGDTRLVDDDRANALRENRVSTYRKVPYPRNRRYSCIPMKKTAACCCCHDTNNA